eukprot:4397200-Prymnesium_polylepis.7
MCTHRKQRIAEVIKKHPGQCCFGAQCISSDKMTGALVVTNAQSQSARATSSKASTVQKVWPGEMQTSVNFDAGCGGLSFNLLTVRDNRLKRSPPPHFRALSQQSCA